MSHLINRKGKCLIVLSTLCLSVLVQAQQETPANSPCGEKCYAGIEIGGKGIKYVVVKSPFFPEEPREPFAQNKGQRNPDPAADIKHTGKIADSTLKEIGDSVSQLFQDIKEQHKVAGNHIYIVGSSGVASAENKGALMQEVLDKTVLTMEFISVEDEACLQLKAASRALDSSPKKGRNAVASGSSILTAMLIDIGSSNTKGCYQQNFSSESTDLLIGEKTAMRVFGMEYGTSSFSVLVRDFLAKQKPNVAADDDKEFAQSASQLWSQEVLPLLNVEVEKKPGLQSRPQVYLTGGIVWIMMNSLVPSDERLKKQGLHEISPEDIQKFYNLVKVDAHRIWSQLSEKQQEKFPVGNIIAGAQILKGLSDHLRFCRNNCKKNRKKIFWWNDPTSWLFEYTLAKAKAEVKDKTEETDNKTESETNQ